MKVLLISPNIACSPYPVYPLGLSILASALSEAGHEVCQFDFLQNNQSINTLINIIKTKYPHIIGLSIRNIDNVNLLHEQRYLDVVKDIIRSIREHTDALIVLGGSGFSIMPELILNEVGADYGIVGEGESLMVEFVAKAARRIFPEQRCIRSSSKLDGKKISSPRYDPHLMEFYLKSGKMASVQTKRGCAHNCIYCSYPLLEGTELRCRDTQVVIDDIQLLMEEHKAEHIFFTDSVFNDDQQHYLTLVEEMVKRGIQIPWTAFFKPEGLNDESIGLMKQTGLMAVEIGADAPTDATLKRIGKTFLFKDIIACNKLFLHHGISTAHYFMFGCPGETRETVIEGIKNIKGLKETVSFIFMGIRIFPKTILAQIATREGLISHDQELLEPVYYISPQVEKEWLKGILTEAFCNIRHCIFPPDSLDETVRVMHKMGYPGPLWHLLIPKRKTKQKNRHL